MVNPRSRTSAAACARNASLAAPFQRGSVSGKVHADVAQRRRAQQRVGDGVRKNIGVGVALQAEFAGDGDASQNQRAARRKAMRIPAQAGANFTHSNPIAHDAVSPASSSPRNSRASSMSEGLVILMLRSLPWTTLTSACSRRSTRLASSVPVKLSRARGLEGALQQIEAEHLRSLRQHQVLARQGRADLVLLHPLDRIHRNDADDGRAGLRPLRRSPVPPARSR